MSWHFLQEQAEASWEGTCLAGAPDALLSLMPTAEACYSPASATGCCRPSRSGTTCEPSTASRGEDELMLCPGAFHVKTSALPAEATDSMASAPAYGWKWPGSFAKWNRSSCSWRTRQCSLIEGLDEFSETWPRWGLMLDGECLEQTHLAPRSTGSEFGYWQTPTTRDGKGQSGKGNRIKRGKNGRLHVANLCDQIVDIGRPDLVRSVKFRLALMGWPEGWTSCEPLATDRFHAWRQAHGCF